MKHRASHCNNYHLQTCAYTHSRDTHMHTYGLGSLYGTTPITPHATVVTAITVAAIKGHDGCSLSKIDSNKHLPENSTILRSNRRFLRVPIQLV